MSRNNMDLFQLIRRAQEIEEYMKKHVFFDDLKYDYFYSTAELKTILQRCKNLSVQVPRIDIYWGKWIDYNALHFEGKHLISHNTPGKSKKDWFLPRLKPFLASNEVLTYYVAFDVQ